MNEDDIRNLTERDLKALCDSLSRGNPQDEARVTGILDYIAFLREQIAELQERPAPAPPTDENERATELARRDATIKKYEAMYGMTSEEFYVKWKDGTAPDDYETNHWANMLRHLDDED